MMLPILISRSLTPGPYCFSADALPATRLKAAKTSINSLARSSIGYPPGNDSYGLGRRSHQRRDPADDPGIAQGAGRLHEVAHLAHDLMHRCILAREALQGGVEVHAFAEIMRALPACLLVDEVALRHCPRRGQKVIDSRIERSREPLERLCVRNPCFDKPSQGTGLLRGDTHPLADRRTESADCVAERQEIIRKTLQRLEAPASAAGKDESVDWTDRYGALDRGIKRLGSQRPGKCDEVRDVFRHGSAMHMVEIDLPAVVLDWNKQPAAAAPGGGSMQHRAPVWGRGRWNPELGRRIVQVDADLPLFRPRQANPIQQFEG